MFKLRGESDQLKLIAEWRKVSEGLRPQVLAGAWRRGERNVAKLSKALEVSRDTVYADLREQGIDYRDRKAPVEDDPGFFDYEYLSERRLDALVASHAVQIAMRAFVEGYNPANRYGRAQLLESFFDQSTNTGDLTRCEAALSRGRLEVPGVGQAALWRGTTTEPDGRTVGLGLLGVPEETDDRATLGLLLLGQRDVEDAASAALTDDGVALARVLRLGDENPGRAESGRGLEPEPLQRGVDNLADVIAASPTVPEGVPQQCLYLQAGTVTGQRAWGETTVDEVHIGAPLWLYQRVG